jgi:hypothetical protein
MHVVDKALGPRGFGPGTWSQKERTDGAEEAEEAVTKDVPTETS